MRIFVSRVEVRVGVSIALFATNATQQERRKNGEMRTRFGWEGKDTVHTVRG